ncbi:hypothetical protein N0V83_006377 [Neocucurbitaria cava]|uniref:Uncharacterized protein n=1 Tax=Neocucurbitaria cava TaxID=798079 RepID=A0A9W8Y626_9PLEO|nr:hypothetical protein N0V83_006377 [Neocucurbitaria cava]
MTKPYNMKVDPLSPLSWDNTDFRRLFEDYWHRRLWDNDYLQSSSDTNEDEDYDGPWKEFYQDNGYINALVPDQSEMLDNEVHPIFGFSNWITHFDYFDYDNLQPALRLASQFLEDPHMLKWWIHLRYGQPGIEGGRVCIKDHPDEHIPEATERIKDQLRKVAPQIKIIFLSHEDIQATGECMGDLRSLRVTFKNACNVAVPDLEYNLWDSTQQITITINEDNYDRVCASCSRQMQLRNHLYLAMTLVHELAHACALIWQPDACFSQESLIQPTDHLPEAGLSWEKFVFGGHIDEHFGPGPPLCAEFDHTYPSTTGVNLPLSAPIPGSYISQWFFKDTWADTTKRLDQLRLPTIRKQTEVYLIDRLVGKEFTSYLYVNGISQSPPYDKFGSAYCMQSGVKDQDTENPSKTARAKKVIQRSTSSSQPDYKSIRNHHKKLNGTSNKAEATSSGNEMQSPESKIPATAADVVAWYARVWYNDLDQAKEQGISIKAYGPHFYSYLRQICCPYSQIDVDAELELPTLEDNEETRKHYRSPVRPCYDCMPYCLSLYHEHKIPAVPFSQRLMTEVTLKRAHFWSESRGPRRVGLKHKRPGMSRSNKFMYSTKRVATLLKKDIASRSQVPNTFSFLSGGDMDSLNVSFRGLMREGVEKTVS